MIRVLIMAQVPLYREGLAFVLSHDERFEVAGLADADAAGMATLVDDRPDVALVDCAGVDAATLLRHVALAAPEVRVVVLGMDEDEPTVVACAEAGMSGYVPRDGALRDLLATIESVAAGDLRCSPRVAGALLRRVTLLASDHGPAPESRLTDREAEIVALIEAGLSNKQIAQRLCIQLPTVKNHVHSILDKLGVHRRGEAAAWARTYAPARRLADGD